MGLWETVKNWVSLLVDWILRPIVKALTNAIEWITAELRALKYNVAKTISKWLENDWVFLFTVIGAIAAVYILPTAINWIASWAIWDMLSKFMQRVKKGLARLVDLEVVIQLDLLNDLLKAFWPEYRSMIADFHNAVSGLAEALGEGTGWLHSYLGFGRALTGSMVSFTGLEAFQAEYEWYGDAQEFVRKVDENFRHYAHNPGEIFDDWIDEHVVPWITEYQAGNQELIDTVETARERAENASEGLARLDIAVAEFKALWPEAIQEKYADAFDTLDASIEHLRDFVDEKVLPKIDGVYGALEEYQDRQETINENIREMLAAPQRIIPLYAEMIGEDRVFFSDGMAGIVADSYDRDFADIREARRSGYAIFVERIGALLRGKGRIEAAVTSPAERAQAPGEAPPEYDTWYVGEYGQPDKLPGKAGD